MHAAAQCVAMHAHSMRTVLGGQRHAAENSTTRHTGRRNRIQKKYRAENRSQRQSKQSRYSCFALSCFAHGIAPSQSD